VQVEPKERKKPGPKPRFNNPQEKKDRKRDLDRWAQQRRRLKVKRDKAKTEAEREAYQKMIDDLYCRTQDHTSESQTSQQSSSQSSEASNYDIKCVFMAYEEAEMCHGSMLVDPTLGTSFYPDYGSNMQATC